MRPELGAGFFAGTFELSTAGIVVVAHRENPQYYSCMNARGCRFFLAVGLAAVLAPPAVARVAQDMTELSRHAKAHKEASTLKVWYNEDVEVLRFHTTISVIGQEPPPPPAPEANAAESTPANSENSGRNSGMSMEERQSRIAAIEEDLAQTEATLRQMKDQLSEAKTEADRGVLNQTIKGWEAAAEKLRAEIERVRTTPPPKPAKKGRPKTSPPASSSQTPPPTS